MKVWNAQDREIEGGLSMNVWNAYIRITCHMAREGESSMTAWNAYDRGKWGQGNPF